MKKELIEQHSEVYKFDGYPPIAGKILGLFYVSDKKYFTFEDLMKEIPASKSAVSKALKILIDRKDINFIYKESNKRKRLFYFDIEGFISGLEDSMKAYTYHRTLLQKSLETRSNENIEMNEFIQKAINFNKSIISVIQEKIDTHLRG